MRSRSWGSSRTSRRSMLDEVMDLASMALRPSSSVYWYLVADLPGKGKCDQFKMGSTAASGLVTMAPETSDQGLRAMSTATGGPPSCDSSSALSGDPIRSLEDKLLHAATVSARPKVKTDLPNRASQIEAMLRAIQRK